MMNAANESLFVFPALRACAHCGGDAHIEIREGIEPFIAWIECDACHAASDSHYHEDEATAVLAAAAAWNRRTYETATAFPAGWLIERANARTFLLTSPTGDAYTFTPDHREPVRAFLWKFLTGVVDTGQPKRGFTAL